MLLASWPAPTTAESRRLSPDCGIGKIRLSGLLASTTVVCSRIDALFSVAPAVTLRNLEDFFFLAEYILSERDPALDLPAESRWTAAVYDKVRNHSEALRAGVRETLILLAAHGNRLFEERLGANTEQRVETFIRRLLEPLTLEKLLSHKADFPDYAEAAPLAVLDLLAEDLETSETRCARDPAVTGGRSTVPKLPTYRTTVGT